MVDKPVFLTPEGRAMVEAELEELRSVKRPEVEERIRASKEFSNTTDNTEFDQAKTDLDLVDHEIRKRERMLANAVLIDGDHAKHRDAVTLGSTVTVADDEGETVYTIVGSAEASPARGMISNESPVGRAIMGHKRGDRVEVVTPGGVLKITIKAID